MGTARVEIYRMQDKRDQFPGQLTSSMPLQVETETTSTSPTTENPDARITVDNQPSYDRLHASVVVDEDCYVAIGADPTADAATSWLLKAGVARVFPVQAGDKFSFKDVA